MRDDEIDTDAPAGPETASRGRPGRPPRTAGGELDAGTRRRLGRALRAHYADLLNAPVPDHFAALIAGLDGGSPPADAAGPPESSDTAPGREDAR